MGTKCRHFLLLNSHFNDVFIIVQVCLAFIFGALLEFALVNYAGRVEFLEKERKKQHVNLTTASTTALAAATTMQNVAAFQRLSAATTAAGSSGEFGPGARWRPGPAATNERGGLKTTALGGHHRMPTSGPWQSPPMQHVPLMYDRQQRSAANISPVYGGDAPVKILEIYFFKFCHQSLVGISRIKRNKE